jgi:uncharacterized membrane protein YeaQ/YmgE (transglycosylase-associated protein family)
MDQITSQTGRTRYPDETARYAMHWVLWIIVIGLIAGVVARIVLPGRDPIGLLGTMAVGIVGALLGWWIGGLLFGVKEVQHHPWLSAIVGAVAVLALVRASTYRRRGLWRGRPIRRWSW